MGVNECNTISCVLGAKTPGCNCEDHREQKKHTLKICNKARKLIIKKGGKARSSQVWDTKEKRWHICWHDRYDQIDILENYEPLKEACIECLILSNHLDISILIDLIYVVYAHGLFNEALDIIKAYRNHFKNYYEIKFYNNTLKNSLKPDHQDICTYLTNLSSRHSLIIIIMI